MISPLLTVRDLLLRLFQPDELRMFIHLRIDPALGFCLPDGLSAELLAYRAAVALEQRGYLGREFFDCLAAERPLRAADIEAAARRITAPIIPSLAKIHHDKLRTIATNLETFLATCAATNTPPWFDGWTLVQQQLEALRGLLALPTSHDIVQTLDDLHNKSRFPTRHQFAAVARAAIYALVCAELTT